MTAVNPSDRRLSVLLDALAAGTGDIVERFEIDLVRTISRPSEPRPPWRGAPATLPPSYAPSISDPAVRLFAVIRVSGSWSRICIGDFEGDRLERFRPVKSSVAPQAVIDLVLHLLRAVPGGMRSVPVGV
jgi:hypothetical protein